MASSHRSTGVASSEKGLKTRSPEPHKPFIKIRNRSGSEDVHYSLLYEGLPEAFQRQAEKELNETADGRRRGIQKLKEYMKSKDLPPLKDELLLLAVLRNTKYDMRKAEVKLKNLISARQEIVRSLRELGMEKMETILVDMGYGLLPYRDKKGRPIFYTRPYGVRLDQYEMNDVGLAVAVGCLFILSFPITTVAGFAYYGECKSPSLQMFYSIFKAFKKYAVLLLSLPIRIARVEILNENSMCRWFYNFIYPLMSRKIMSRVSLHGSNFEQFHELYDPDILPEDFGGSAGPLSCEVYRQRFLDFAKGLISEES